MDIGRTSARAQAGTGENIEHGKSIESRGDLSPHSGLSPRSTVSSGKFNLKRAMRQLDEEIQLTASQMRVHSGQIEQAKMEVKQFETNVDAFNNENIKTLSPTIQSLMENLNNHIQMQKAENDLYSKQIAEMRRDKASLQAQFQSTTNKVFGLEEFIGLND